MTKKLNRRQFVRRSTFAVAGTLIAYPTLIERYSLTVNEYEIFVPYLPKEFNGYKILHFADLHYGILQPMYVVKRVVEIANSAGADLIACTGDYVKRKKTDTELVKVWPEIMKLKAKDGVYIVLGNHDHWADHNKALELLEASGRSVRHKAVSIERNGKKLWIAGTGDLYEDELGIDKALKDVPETDCRIVLAHNPDTADKEYSSRIDLMLSGHTHGGQVDIPILGPLALPVKNKIYKSGFVKGPKCNVFISRGIGWSGMPLRFNCTPELAILKLKCEGPL